VEKLMEKEKEEQKEVENEGLGCLSLINVSLAE